VDILVALCGVKAGKKLIGWSETRLLRDIKEKSIYWSSALERAARSRFFENNLAEK